ncbi:polysaccharide/polyol phosphate ABC transporter ATPase [Sulfuricella denitrificans skB26]|uniref:Polysaccharide/polyol phosphate ABC transporter ATPase n=1 Tax=Sulfuricella denitrificans (strain DSM 22764 / NBRC 105220 / skB26) TaxID=1163617 RepID=S6B8Y4_SULDS|nr:ABC transporter ATP-binding protein [Sulfuricella denitrificans]BAN36782.1 polysaccharide/polyol phosphate ABC transporter ATPase [Sulfuricella denitrificans skB26]
MPIIEVDHVTKEFKLGQLQSLKTTALNQLRRLTGEPIEKRAPFKALDDVTFSIEPGEVVGIIGHNGAGKSTILKLLANISKPSSGSIQVKGKVAPLIEVGAGLVPELTGRENIYLNGSILGMKRAEINNKLDDIVAFAELEEFIDTPIKRYSSGMQVRLGFGIATSVDSDILIVDEVLAVGDLAFQRKSFGRMTELIKDRNRTVLIVSHNIRQIERICTRAILLDHGKLARDGVVGDVCDAFFRGSNDKIAEDAAKISRARVRASGEAEFLSIAVIKDSGQPVTEVASGDPLRIRVKFRLDVPLEKPELILGTHTTDFFYLTGSSTAVFDSRPDFEAGVHEVEVVFQHYPLTAGIYCLRFAIFDKDRRAIFVGDNLGTFKVKPGHDEVREEGLRMLDIPATWALQGHTFQSRHDN